MSKILLHTNKLDIGYVSGQKNTVIQSSLNLQLKAGELICLIGPNGVGKSTLLKTLGRLMPPVSGDIVLGETSLKHINQYELAKKIGLVLTAHADVPHIRVIDMISMGRYPYTGLLGNLSKQDLEIVEQVAETVGLQSLLERPFAELSDGERQKVMIAKALAQKTPVMLLDEPTAFLDFPTKASLLIMLRKLAREQNIGIILSTHDIELALKTADKLWLFPRHQQVVSGCPEDLVLQGVIQKVFQNSVMSFDIHTGHFVKTFHSEKNVSVVGEDENALWLKKALIRNEIMPDKEADWVVKCSDEYSLYYRNKLVTQAKNIDEVLHLIEFNTNE